MNNNYTTKTQSQAIIKPNKFNSPFKWALISLCLREYKTNKNRK